MPRLLLSAMLLILLNLRIVGIAQSSAPQDSTRPKPVAKVFRKELPMVKKLAGVPIYLPSELPPMFKEANIHCVSGRGDKKGYDFNLYSECGFGDSAFVGWFSGKVGKMPRFREVVRLANGVNGYFHAKSCGGSCAPTMVMWEHGGVVYTIQLRLNVETADEERILITNTANSAIRGGAR
jgi:hypothetical protein